MDKSLFPIDNAETFFRGFNQALERDGMALRWPSHYGVTELAVKDIHQRTHDGLVVSELVTLTHTSSRLVAVTPEYARHLNTWATLSAFVPAFAAEPARLVSKVGIFSSDREAAERVYAPLLCMEAGLVGWHAARLIRGEFRADPSQSPLSKTDEPPPFDSADFESIKVIADRRGFVGSLGKDQFTVEFPWEPGARSNMFAYEDVRQRIERVSGISGEDLDRMAGRTSLLQILAMDHPLYGKGIQSRLEIPLPLDRPATAQLVDELNRWELSGTDLPPLFGAWCIGDRAPAFVSFIPTQMCFPGLLRNLLIWAAARQARVREWIISMSSAQ